MSYIKMALYSFAKNKLTFIFIIIETGALFLALNFLVSTLNDIDILNRAYKDILADNGYTVYDENSNENFVFEGLDTRQSREKILENLTGNYKVYDIIYLMDESGVMIYSVSDEIYSKLAVPLSFGNYSKGVCSPDISLGEYNAKLHDGKTLTIPLSGKLTLSTYIPQCGASKSNGFSTKDMYSISFNTQKTIIINRSSVADFIDEFHFSPQFIIQFDDENAEQNIKKLNENSSAYSGELILENTEKELERSFMKFMPVIVCVLIITLIGTLSISMILHTQNEYRNGCLWICGYSRKQIIFSQAVNILFPMIIAAAIGVIVFAVWRLFENSPAAGMSISIYNFAVSILMCLLLTGTATAIPYFKSINKSPIEYLRRVQ